jgi:hypothetical protein
MSYKLSTTGGTPIESLSGDTVNYADNLDSGYLSRLKAAYNLLMEKCAYRHEMIPIILTTDQHNRVAEHQWKGVYRWLADTADWQGISKVVNLGDSATNGAASELLAVMDCIDLLPLDKQVNVWGNHDYGNDSSSDHAWVKKYFKNGCARYGGGNGYFVAYDDLYNVKYLCMNNWEHVGSAANTHYYGSVTSEQYAWAIAELSKNDGYDTIICSHDSWDAVGVTWLDDDDGMKGWRENYDLSTESTWEHDADAQAGWLKLLADRKHKRSGTFTDSLGVTHPYDFTNCENDVLVSLHGHWHTDFYKQHDITMVEFDCYKEKYTVYFCYIDRTNKKFGWWKVDLYVTQSMEIDIN